MPRLFFLILLLLIAPRLALGRAVRIADRISLWRDVQISSLTTGQPLVYNRSTWANTSLGISHISGQQAALDAKETACAVATAQAFAIQRANHTGTQAQSTITSLVSDLAGKRS